MIRSFRRRACLLEQLKRTPEQRREIEADAATRSPRYRRRRCGADWFVAGGALAALARSPLEETYNLLTRGGIVRAGPADIVVLSLNCGACACISASATWLYAYDSRLSSGRALARNQSLDSNLILTS